MAVVAKVNLTLKTVGGNMRDPGGLQGKIPCRQQLLRARARRAYVLSAAPEW